MKNIPQDSPSLSASQENNTDNLKGGGAASWNTNLHNNILTKEAIQKNMTLVSSNTMMPRFNVQVESHLKNNSEKVYEMFKAGNFADCILTSGQTVVKAHRVILSTVEYFESMFLRGWSETISASADLTQSIPDDILAAIVEFIYLGSVELKSIEKVLQMFYIADKFCMEVYMMFISC